MAKETHEQKTSHHRRPSHVDRVHQAQYKALYGHEKPDHEPQLIEQMRALRAQGYFKNNPSK